YREDADHLCDLGVRTVDFFKMIVEKLVFEGMFRKNAFPGGLNEGNGFFRFVAIDLYRRGAVSPVFLIEKKHGFNLIMKRIKIEVSGYAHDIAKRVKSEMFTEQGRKFG